MVGVFELQLLASLHQGVEGLIPVGVALDDIVVEDQVIAGPVAHQHVAVAVQKIAPGSLDGGVGGVGTGIVRIAACLDDLQREELDAVKRQDQAEQTQQHSGTESAYSFHGSPPILPMALTRGYRGSSAAVENTAVRKKTPARLHTVRFKKIPMSSSPIS